MIYSYQTIHAIEFLKHLRGRNTSQTKISGLCRDALPALEDAILYFKRRNNKDYTKAKYYDCRGVILKMMKKLRLTQRVQRVESTIILANKFCMRNVTYNC